MKRILTYIYIFIFVNISLIISFDFITDEILINLWTGNRQHFNLISTKKRKERLISSLLGMANQTICPMFPSITARIEQV